MPAVSRSFSFVYLSASPHPRVLHRVSTDSLHMIACAGVNERAGGRAGHAFCRLGSFGEGELCPHGGHLALRVADGTVGDALNARKGL